MIRAIVVDRYAVGPNQDGIDLGQIRAIGASGPTSILIHDDPHGLFEIRDEHLRLRSGRSIPPGPCLFAEVEIEAKAGPSCHRQRLRIVRDEFRVSGVIAHRGAWAHGHGARNSMTALRDAIAKGFTAFECDLVWSSDEVVLVAHGPRANSEDGDLDLPMWTTPWAQLREVSLGNGDRFSTLAEVLDVVMSQNRTRAVLEIKAPSDGPSGEATAAALATRVVEIVHAHRAQAWVRYISFSPAALAAILARDPSAACAPLSPSPGASPQTYVDAGMWGVDFNHQNYSAASVAGFRAAGLDVNAWTVNADADMNQLIGWGASHLTTDEPERLESIWAAKTRVS